jgi:hypothetical protein
MAADEYAEPAYSPTPHCHDDARLLKEALLEYCDYAEQDILLELLEPNAPITPTDLLSKIEAMGKKSEPGDTILFFYAGHGGLFNNDTYLILPTTLANNKTQTAVPFRDISNALRLPGRVNVRVFDTCHSGLDVRAIKDRGDRLVRDNELDVEGLVREVAMGTEEGWITFAACKADEYSHPDFKIKQGVFTWAFCESLKALPAETDVHPEILKVALCKRVKEWCDTNGFTQTPVYNSAVSGNVHIARRKAPPPPVQVVGPRPEETVPELEERLAALRKFPRVGSEDHREKLKSYINKVKTRIDALKAGVDSFGCEKSVDAPDNIYNLPAELRPRVVRFIHSKNFRPLHEVEVREVANERPLTISERIQGVIGPVVTKSTEYVLRQSFEWPLSYVSFTVKSDGHVPGALLFFYLIPMQLRASLISGVALSRQRNFADDDWSMVSIGHILVNFDDNDTAMLEAFVTQWVGILNGTLRKSLASRLAILEEELNLKS